jgi:HAD superfamily hydrolase (TIGR01509 family)
MLRAIIFDCDGVLIDSEPVHFLMFRKVFAEEGITLTQADYEAKYLAMDDKGCFTAVLRDRGERASGERVAGMVRRKAVYFEQAMRADPPTFPGVAQFIRAAAARYLLAIASGALRREVEFAMDGIGVRDCFRVVVAAEDVTRGKPDPEAYLTAMAGLSRLEAAGGPLRPEQCLVVEDSFHGVEAAKRAGMLCLAVTNTYPADKLSRADWVVARLDEFDLRAAEKAAQWSPGRV